MLWNRRFELRVFPKDSEQFTVGGGQSADRSYKIQFDFTRRFGGSSSDFGQLTIFNPSYDLIHSTARGTKIEFWVGYGYGTELQMLFDGYVINAFQELHPPDMTVTIWFNRMIRSIDKTEPTTKVIKEETPLGSVLAELVKTDFGMGLWFPLSEKSFMEQMVKPQTFSSNAREALDELAEEYKFYWSMTGTDVRIAPFSTKPDPSNVVSIINVENGLIGTPTINVAGLDLTCFMRPNILNGDTISVNSPSYTYGGDSNLSYVNRAEGGDRSESVSSLIDPNNREVEKETRYVWVQEITHSGDTRDDTWETKITGLHGNRQGGTTIS